MADVLTAPPLDDLDDPPPPPEPEPDKPPAKRRATRARKPRKRAPAKPAAAAGDKAPRARKPGTPGLEKQVAALIGNIGLIVAMFSPTDGEAILKGAEAQAAALVALGKQHPAVARVLDAMVTTNLYGQVANAFAPTAITIAANHGKVPPMIAAMFGAPTPPPPGGPDDAGSTPPAVV